MKKIILCFILFMALTISIGIRFNKNNSDENDIIMNYSNTKTSNGQDVISRLHNENKKVKENKTMQSKINSSNAEKISKDIENEKQIVENMKKEEELKIQQIKENELKQETISIDNTSLGLHINNLNEKMNNTDIELDENKITTSDKIDTLNDTKVLSKVISSEGAGRTYEEKVAIGSVILNRVKDDKFPNTIKEVVKETNSYKNGYFNICITTETDVKASSDALDGKSGVNSALYYFNGSKEQIDGLEYITTVGDLSFYK